MYQKLETRLMLYEKDHPIKDDHELLAAIESILDEQDSLPVEERDFDLIAEATNTILKLQGYDENHLDEMAYEAATSVRTQIADKRKGTSNGQLKSKRHHVLRWVIPLVAILAMTSVAVFASPTNRLIVSEFTHRIYSTLAHNVTYSEDNIDLVITDDIEIFSSFEELSKRFNHSLFLPFSLNDEIRDLVIRLFSYGESYDINISFVYENSPCTIIISNQAITSENISKYNYMFGDRSVLLSDCKDYILAEWDFEQYYYQIKAPNIDLIKSISTSMELSDE